jgi:carboxypeptidase PM20D1
VRRPLAIAAALPALFLGVLVVRAALFRSRQPTVAPAAPVPVDPGAAGRLAGAIRFRTVSRDDPTRVDASQFLGLHRYLAESFPAAHRALKREVVAELSLLYLWPGSDPALAPALLLSHLDVVPVDAASEEAWTHPPFAGEIVDGHVWGRGAMDDKVGVAGLLEAVETLVRQGVRPRRTVYLAFGHDEEVGGGRGAANMAALLRDRGVRPEYVLDEGLAIVEGMVPGVAAPVAMVGIAEKGYVSLDIVVEAEGGHSSMPPPETAIGVLAAALVRLEAHQMPAAITGPTRRFFEAIGPEMSFPMRIVLGNLWLFGPLVERRLEASPATNATIRTTTAPTMLEGSPQANVLPVRARAVVNCRIRPGDSVASVVEHVRAAVADPRVTITPQPRTTSEPSPESPVDAPAFAALARAIRAVHPGTVVAPSLVVGATDARHYAGLSPNVYRFLPWRIGVDDLHRVHGIDERMSVENYDGAVRFYVVLLRSD